MGLNRALSNEQDYSICCLSCLLGCYGIVFAWYKNIAHKIQDWFSVWYEQNIKFTNILLIVVMGGDMSQFSICIHRHLNILWKEIIHNVVFMWCCAIWWLMFLSLRFLPCFFFNAVETNNHSIKIFNSIVKNHSNWNYDFFSRMSQRTFKFAALLNIKLPKAVNHITNFVI